MPKPVDCTRVYLNGFMGSGKSTLGPKAAERLGWSFSDLDERIVEVIGMPIGEFFRREGETAFREIEAERLRATGQRRSVVVAVGGGALCREASLQWALRHGIVIFLRVPAKELVRRLKAESSTRPMLLNGDGTVVEDDVLEGRIETLLAAREEYYSQAHLIVDVRYDTVEAAVSEILAGVRDFLNDTL